jgi:hypothetical protein
METLTSAVKLMKIVCEEPSAEENNNVEWKDNLRQAQKYSSTSMRFGKKSMSLPIKPIWSQAHAYSCLQSSEFFDQVPMAIYIEQITMEEGNEKAVLFFECAIVLYNLGLSHSLLAEESEGFSFQNAIRESSLHVLELAETVLANMYEHCLSSSNYIHETILFNMLLMRGLIQNKQQLNRASCEHCKVLSDLLSYLRQQRQLYPEANELSVASAA